MNSRSTQTPATKAAVAYFKKEASRKLRHVSVWWERTHEVRVHPDASNSPR
jgi:hypothetical protein